jgi:hypothetical protein
MIQRDKTRNPQPTTQNPNPTTNLIYSTPYFNICQDKNKHTTFTISTTNPNKNNYESLDPLFNSLTSTKLINYSTIIKENNTKTLLLKASSFESFEDFKKKYYRQNNSSNQLPYNVLFKIIYSLSTQIHYLLENESKCFYKLDISNIFVINDNKFIYLSYDDLKDVKEKNIYIYTPIIKTSGFLSPELKNVTSIPIIVNYKTIFYSLGLFILNSINNETISIEDTKLYYFLMRCLCKQPENRFLLYV